MPDWANVVQISMTTKETMWCYRRGDTALGFVLDRDGYVVAITAGGKQCAWVRTALAEPKRTVKLGDTYKKVIDRYGFPMDTSTTPGSGYSRDVTLHYGYDNNIDFTLRDMKVRRIYIWESQLRRPEAVRLPSRGQGISGSLGPAGASMPATSGFRR